MDTFIADFLEFLSVEKSASGNTISAYRNDLGQVEEFLASRKNGSGIQWPTITQEEVLEYIAGHDHVWQATAGEILDSFVQQQSGGQR